MRGTDGTAVTDSRDPPRGVMPNRTVDTFSTVRVHVGVVSGQLDFAHLAKDSTPRGPDILTFTGVTLFGFLNDYSPREREEFARTITDPKTMVRDGGTGYGRRPPDRSGPGRISPAPLTIIHRVFVPH